MGLFSWFTVEGAQIVSDCSEHKFVVYMHSPDGSVWAEKDYEGYGVFGGKDYYELLAELNGKKTRDEGIDIAFANMPPPYIIYPILSERHNYTGRFNTPNQTDECQGSCNNH